MIEDDKERLSALLDGELSEGEAHGLTGRLSRDPDLRGLWDRYHLIGDAMRGEASRPRIGGIADRVGERVQDEPPLLAPGALAPPRSRRWLRPAAGAAVAASVAAAVVFTAPSLIGDKVAPTAVVEQSPSPAAAPPDTGTRWRRVGPEVESRLNRYLVDHGEYTGTGAVHRVLPYASFVSYDAGR